MYVNQVMNTWISFIGRNIVEERKFMIIIIVSLFHMVYKKSFGTRQNSAVYAPTSNRVFIKMVSILSFHSRSWTPVKFPFFDDISSEIEIPSNDMSVQNI